MKKYKLPMSDEEWLQFQKDLEEEIRKNDPPSAWLPPYLPKVIGLDRHADGSYTIEFK